MNIKECRFYSEKEYISTSNGYTEYPDYCSCYSDGHCFNHLDCYYRQLQKANETIQDIEEDVSDFVSDVASYFKYDDRQPDNLDELLACINSTMLGDTNG